MAQAEKKRMEAWGFDFCKKPSGRDHGVIPGEMYTLCGLHVNPNGFPSGEPFRPDESYACRNCRRVLARA